MERGQAKVEYMAVIALALILSVISLITILKHGSGEIANKELENLNNSLENFKK